MTIATILTKIKGYILNIITYPMQYDEFIARVGYQEYLIYNHKTNKWIIFHTGIMSEAKCKFTDLPQWIQDRVNSDEYARTLIR